MEKVHIGIIGGGLMGKEAASAFGRWFVLNDFHISVELTAVCDSNEEVLSWYKQISTVKLFTTDYKTLLADTSINVVYVALPHNLHEEIYIDVIKSGKDLLAEKPFGIDLNAAQAIKKEADKAGCFLRCSSEMPFLPGAQRAISHILSGALGKIIQIKAGFLHSSDMDPQKPMNWKRQNEFCGEIGVMGDLGMHVMHIPLRLGWKPQMVYSQLQKIITERPDSNGSVGECDTWNNAALYTKVKIERELVPMSLEMKRLAPGETNTWFIEVLGVNGGVKYSTKDTKTLWTFHRGVEQVWQRVDLGFQVPFPVITGGIFEIGFPDCFMQMLAAFIAERAGRLNGRFGCATAEEAIESHKVFAAALQSHERSEVIKLCDIAEAVP